MIAREEYEVGKTLVKERYGQWTTERVAVRTEKEAQDAQVGVIVAVLMIVGAGIGLLVGLVHPGVSIFEGTVGGAIVLPLLAIVVGIVLVGLALAAAVFVVAVIAAAVVIGPVVLLIVAVFSPSTAKRFVRWFASLMKGSD